MEVSVLRDRLACIGRIAVDELLASLAVCMRVYRTHSGGCYMAAGD
jgi:hypothetical protein